jgi:hypothetical protein
LLQPDFAEAFWKRGDGKMSFATKRRYIGLIGATALLLALTLTACGGGGEGASAPEGPTPTPVSEYVIPLPADRPELEVAGPGGVLPCGAGDVQVWGRRKFDLADYPDCVPDFPNLDVYCLDGSARWTDATVSNVSALTDERAVAFDVQQEGFCGLFPQ